MENRKRKGFTLIELMVVIVIIGILGTIVIMNYGGTDDKARVDAAKASLRSIHGAVQRYKLNTGEYPETLENLVTGPSDYEGNWPSMVVGGMSALKDPWGNEYFMTEDNNGEPVIGSYGKDGAEGQEKTEYDKDLYYPETEDSE